MEATLTVMSSDGAFFNHYALKLPMRMPLPEIPTDEQIAELFPEVKAERIQREDFVWAIDKKIGVSNRTDGGGQYCFIENLQGTGKGQAAAFDGVVGEKIASERLALGRSIRRDDVGPTECLIDLGDEEVERLRQNLRDRQSWEYERWFDNDGLSIRMDLWDGGKLRRAKMARYR